MCIRDRSLPVLIRIFQCLKEYRAVGDKSMLGNTVKYCSNLPILACVWYSRVHGGSSEWNQTLTMWLRLFHSSYSLFWDVKMDWFIDISSRRLRSTKLALPTTIYYVGILIDFIIRYWWVWVQWYGASSYFNFIFFDSELQYLEVFRRAIWVVFKLESEYVLKLFSK